MKSIRLVFLSFGLVLLTVMLSAQKMTNAKIRILDSETQDGIEQANVLIQELMIVEKSYQFGIASFDNVPIRQITVEVLKDEYYPKKVELNLRENSFDNNFSIELVKEKDNSIAFFGTIKGKGDRVNNCEITLKVGIYKQSTQSDKQGDFSLVIPKEKISSDIILLITHPKFKDKEIIVDLKQGETYKDLKTISLDYSGGDVRNMKTIGAKNDNYWKVEIKNWVQEGSIVTINAIVQNINENKPANKLNLEAQRALIIDENGSSYRGIESKLGNTSVSGSQSERVPVPYGTSPIVSIKFDVGDQKINRIAMVKFPYAIGGWDFDILISK